MTASFPTTRHRRSRSQPWIRDLIAETHLTSSDFILPLFIRDASLPAHTPNGCGIPRYLPDEIPALLERAASAGILSVMLFPVIESSKKDAVGSEALSKNSLMTQTLKLLKRERLPLGLMVDVALDPYTSHGHDGILSETKSGITLDNDKTLHVLSQMAFALAEAGADVVAPSDMMDGRIHYIRERLDKAGFNDCLIASYAAKYASCFYGPFRDLLGTQKLGGISDKKTYQMDPRNAREALSEVAFDIHEGADMLIIKPGLPYLDIITKAAETTHLPVLGYQVSGEYGMIKAAADRGYLDEQRAFWETFIAFKRAGARGIISYAALEMAEWLTKNK